MSRSRPYWLRVQLLRELNSDKQLKLVLVYIIIHNIILFATAVLHRRHHLRHILCETADIRGILHIPPWYDWMDKRSERDKSATLLKRLDEPLKKYRLHLDIFFIFCETTVIFLFIYYGMNECRTKSIILCDIMLFDKVWTVYNKKHGFFPSFSLNKTPQQILDK